MPKILVFTAGDRAARQHLADSIEHPIPDETDFANFAQPDEWNWRGFAKKGTDTRAAQARASSGGPHLFLKRLSAATLGYSSWRYPRNSNNLTTFSYRMKTVSLCRCPLPLILASLLHTLMIL
jgi:hypothetical protein